MRRPSARGSIDEAERALAAVVDYPLDAEAAALRVLSHQGVEPEAASVAQHAVGLAARETGRLSAAGRRLRRAIAIAESKGLRARAAEARLSLVLVLLQSGYPEAALSELDLVGEQAPSRLRGQVLVQRALIHIRTGHFDDALDESRRALPLLRRAGDRLNEARVLSNRGILRAYRNELGLAERDLHKALNLYRVLGSEIAAAQVLHNLGYVSALKGDVPAALKRYDEAARTFAEQGIEAPALSIDRAELLLSARLLPESRRQIELGVAALETAGNSLDLAEARLLFSQIALAQNDLFVSGSTARSARRQLLRQGRPRWAALAQFVEAQSRWSAGTAPARVAAEAVGLADSLRDAGWSMPSLECRLLGARAALQAGENTTARALVDSIGAKETSGAAAQRVRARYGEALGRLGAGNRRGALAALSAGLAIANDHRATLGATELRVRTATTVTELASLGLDIAFESGGALQVLRWSERWRAGALGSPRVTPPSDPRLASLLAALRDTVARLERASLEGSDTEFLAGRQTSLEAQIRERSRFAVGDFTEAPRFPDQAELRETLGERVLVEYLEHKGRLHVVIGDRRGFRLRLLGSAAQAEGECVAMQFALSRLALARSSRSSLEAAAALLERSCHRLAGLLVDPLQHELGDRDLIVVPTGPLHAVAWALVPPLRGRNMTVAPSTSLWYSRQIESTPRLASGAGVVLVAGPRIAQAEDEITQIQAGFYPRARMLLGPGATTRSVARAFEGCRLAHVAAHGTFRADNPQFSSLELADGPLTVYDLEHITRAPQWIVLSACDAGRSSVHPGDELMGTSAALLSLGTRAIVSSVASVPDDGVTQVMITVHDELGRGKGLASGLASAQARALPPTLEFGDLASDDRRAREALAAAALVCLGAG
jgi:CHAT domain-containing protein/Tfp pilus assembly protein PilF